MSIFPAKIRPKTEEEILKIKASCDVVVKALAHVASLIRPGVSGTYLDKQAEQLIQDLGAQPAFKGYRGFPASLCISVNAGVVHGIPSGEFFREGDVVSVDCGAELNGYFGDSAYTFALGVVPQEVTDLLRITNESLYLGVAAAKAGNRTGDIAFAIQEHTEFKHKYGVVRELVGHGVGNKLHEPPDIPNFGRRGNGPRLEEGWTLAIEPMINLGTKEVYQAKDNWTILTKDGKPSAHFEHTIVVRKTGAQILTGHEPIVAEIKNNQEIINIPINI